MRRISRKEKFRYNRLPNDQWTTFNRQWATNIHANVNGNHAITSALPLRGARPQ